MRPFRTVLPLLALTACSAAPETTQTTRAPLQAVCVAPDQPLDAGWACGTPLTVECTAPEGVWVDAIYVQDVDCAAPTVSLQGPFALGDWTVVVSQDAAVLCESELRVVDTAPPEVAPLDLALWPPNHKLVEVFPEDCVAITDACDPAPEVTFTWATSDEPEDGLGDGNHSPDIQLTPDSVMLRAERSGGGDGRVYTLGWRAVDAAGHVVDGACRVTVPHDQGDSAAVDSGPAYTVETGQNAPAALD